MCSSFLREEDARGEVDQLAVVERDQRMRDGTARVVDDGELADERRRQQSSTGSGSTPTLRTIVEYGRASSRARSTMCVSASSSGGRGRVEMRARLGARSERDVPRARSSAPVGRRGRARRRAARPRAPRARPSSSRAAKISGRVGVPSRRSFPATLPVSIVVPEQSRMSSAIWNAIPSASPNRPIASSRRPSRHAARKSSAVLSVQRRKYSSSVVSACAPARAGSPRPARGRAQRRRAAIRNRTKGCPAAGGDLLWRSSC